MFRAYIDESGTHDSSAYIVIGGLIVSSTNSVGFQNAWRQALLRAEVPYSHMREFTQSVGPFAKWRSEKREFEPQRQAFMKDLCDCVITNVCYTFGAVLTRAHYDALVPADLREAMGSPYTFLGRYCIARVGVWAQNQGIADQVNLIFEQGQPHSSLKLQHNLLSANERAKEEFRLGVLSFADKRDEHHPEDAMALQAADLVAYELLKHWNTLKQHSERRVRPYVEPDLRRYPLKRLMELPRDWNELTAEDVRREATVWRTGRAYAAALKNTLP